MTVYTVTVDWTEIHAAAGQCDAARRGTYIGRDWPTDCFGGSYNPVWYESLGVAGLAALARAADMLAAQTWKLVHAGSTDLAAASVVRPTDPYTWGCRLPDGSVRPTSSRQGARWMSTRHGGRVEKIPDGSGARARRSSVAARLRAAVEVAIAVDRLRRLLAASGIIQYTPVADGHVLLTGVRWLRGDAQESEHPPTIAEARAAVAAL